MPASLGPDGILLHTLFPLAVLLGLGGLVSAGLFLLPKILGPKNPVPSRLRTYECGVRPEGEAHAPFPSRFYLVAVLFLLFDVEVAFFFPWALVYRKSVAAGPELLLAFFAYLTFVVIALFYVYRKKAFNLAQTV